MNCAGSSPRVRGSLTRIIRLPLVSGIIPAGAGLTSRMRRGRYRCRDHPRGCGAHDGFTVFRPEKWGSSPRVRGSQRAEMAVICFLGIIPAGAGLTRKLRATASSRRDHPRGCGAHTSGRLMVTTPWGSSPRVRGSLFDYLHVFFCHGIIPAGAGLTLKNPNNYAIPYSFGS